MFELALDKASNRGLDGGVTQPPVATHTSKSRRSVLAAHEVEVAQTDACPPLQILDTLVRERERESAFWA